MWCVFKLQLELDECCQVVDLVNDGGRVGGAPHSARTRERDSVEEVARQAVRRVLGQGVGGAHVHEWAVGETLPCPAMRVGCCFCVVAAVTAKAVVGIEYLRVGDVCYVECPVPVAVRCRVSRVCLNLRV